MTKPRLTPEQFAAKLQRELQARRDKSNRWREAHPDYFKKKLQEFNARNPGYAAQKRKEFNARNPGYSALQRAKRLGRFPGWADPAAMNDVYSLAQEFREAGLDVEVDHIYPLQGWNVSGLHVLGNLRVCLKLSNMSKGTRHPDDAPGPECPYNFVGIDPD